MRIFPDHKTVGWVCKNIECRFYEDAYWMSASGDTARNAFAKLFDYSATHGIDTPTPVVTRYDWDGKVSVFAYIGTKTTLKASPTVNVFLEPKCYAYAMRFETNLVSDDIVLEQMARFNETIKEYDPTFLSAKNHLFYATYDTSIPKKKFSRRNEIIYFC